MQFTMGLAFAINNNNDVDDGIEKNINNTIVFNRFVLVRALTRLATSRFQTLAA